MNEFLGEKQTDFELAIEYYQSDINSLRTGRANPQILDQIRVEAYEIENPINTVASITVADSRSILVTPFDKQIIKQVEKAIAEANLGLGIINDGDKLRLTVPPLTEENRRDLVKNLDAKLEKARIQLRQIREQVKDAIESALADKEISEDERFRSIKELDEYVAKKNEEIKKMRDDKETDIMTI